MGSARPHILRLRRATLRDAERLCELHHSAIRALAQGHYTAEELQAWTYQTPAHFRWALLQPEEWFIVAEGPGGVLGFSSLKRDVLQATYVAPELSGRGIGRRLVARVEREARRRGVTRLRLKASRNAVPFYERLGYARGRNGHLETIAGVPIPYLSMRKDLIPPLAQVAAESTKTRLKERSGANRRHRHFDASHA